MRVPASDNAGRLRELREAAGLTQAQLGERAGLTGDGIAQLERGRRKPAWETVIALADALGVRSEEFRKKPADTPRRGPGRPAKAAAEPGEPQTPKRPRGRPRKGA